MIIKSYQNGFSLVELLVAMVLGLVVSAAAVQIFASNKNTYRLETALSRLQENGRFIVDNMVKDIRMAGYNGCSSRGDDLAVTVIADDPIPFSLTNPNSVRGFNANTSTWTPNVNASDLNLSGVVAGTDILSIQRVSECGAHLTGTLGTTNANVQIDHPNTCGFAKDEVVMITDCSTADVFQINSNPTGSGNQETLTHSNAVNTTNNLSKLYGPDSQVFRMQSNAYYIGTGTSGEPALFRSAWNPNGDGTNTINASDFLVGELADGVEDMQILYGEDTGGDQYADVYVSADSVTDWDAVRSVRINLLLSSPDNVTMEPRSIPFNGATINTGTGADRRLRMAYSSTVSIRNSLP